jgi:2-polyprenyl-3-methyl-5-hydroxy-6-metoxy-1,4-benzoquinol methylase
MIRIVHRVTAVRSRKGRIRECIPLRAAQLRHIIPPSFLTLPIRPLGCLGRGGCRIERLGVPFRAMQTTDNSFSIASREFIWADSDCTPIHRLVTTPVVTALTAAGARNILDLGCGNGAFSAVLATKGFNVEGCDSSDSGLTIARRAYPNLPFFLYDIVNPLPSDRAERYDAVVCIEVVEHLLLPRQLVLNVSAALRPGGTLILTTPFHGYWKNLSIALLGGFDAHWHPLRDFGHVKFFSRRTLTQLVTEGGFVLHDFIRVGRIAPLACSMIVVAIKP